MPANKPQHSKTACILMDRNDLQDFKDRFKSRTSSDACLFPVDFHTIRQLLWGNISAEYYIPQILDPKSCNETTHEIYQKSQKFISQILLANKLCNSSEDYHPLEYMWLSIWVGVYRLVSFCESLIQQCPVHTVYLINRNKHINEGGLLLNTSAFTSIVGKYFQSKEIKTVVFQANNPDRSIPDTIFYDERPDLKSSLKQLTWFLRWKFRTLGKQNHDYLLVRPSNENVINYRSALLL